MKAQSAVTVRCVCVFCPALAESGKIAGIASAIGVALLGAASSYFAYQKKKLCFKLQGGQYVVFLTHQHLMFLEGHEAQIKGSVIVLSQQKCSLFRCRSRER